VSANDPQALIGTLHRLGLCPHEMVVPLKTLSAAGKPLSPYLQVSLYEVDKAISNVENASPLDRMGFKRSLQRAGLMTA
jgi:hypothetical protein